MDDISKLIRIPETKKGEARNYREELLNWFVDNLRDKKGRKYRFVGIKMKLAHLSDFDLSVFKSECFDRLNRGENWQKYFWGALKPK